MSGLGQSLLSTGIFITGHGGVLEKLHPAWASTLPMTLSRDDMSVMRSTPGNGDIFVFAVDTARMGLSCSRDSE